METELLITDVTRMSGDSVCIAGITHQGTTIRPVLPPPGIHERHLYLSDGAMIRPRAVIAIESKPVKAPDPPHVEDHVWYQPERARFMRLADESRWRGALEHMCFPDLASIFEVELTKNRMLSPGEGARSLGTIRARVFDFSYTLKEDDLPKYRLSFYDLSDEGYFNLPITDLALRAMVKHLITHSDIGFENINAHIKSLIRKPLVYLRIGLTRPFQKTRRDDEMCYLQVNGIYTFPDYLDGKCFADFRL
jgi:hypothetical protein